MSIAVAAAIILVDAADVSVPALSMSGTPLRVLASADASIPAWPLPSRRDLAAALPSAEGIGPTGYAIPADHPRPPLGRFKLTAYARPKGRARAITATGTSARAGRTVAVDPKVIPLGSRIFIEGIGERHPPRRHFLIRPPRPPLSIPAVGARRRRDLTPRRRSRI